jgi:hypothetical protein
MRITRAGKAAYRFGVEHRLHHVGILSPKSRIINVSFRVKCFSMWVGGKWRDSVLECGGMTPLWKDI